MANSHLITTVDFCRYHDVEYTFITSLQEAGLVEITVVNETPYIAETELQKLERMIHLHHDLEINVAGIGAITHLLERIEQIQANLLGLQNRLRIYEEE